MNESSCPATKTAAKAHALPLFSLLPKRLSSLVSLCASVLLLSSCGGGGGDGGGGGTPGLISGGNNTWQAGVYKPSDNFKNYCEKPRVGASKITGIPFPDRKGNATQEKNFLRSWSYETYLWFEDLPDVNPDNSDTPQNYFRRLVSDKKTPSGSYKDNFHFYEPTESEEAWSAGITYGYGLHLKINWEVPRTIQVVYADSNSPAANNNVKRGAKIIAVDGLNISTMNANALFDALYPPQINAVHEFEIQDAGTNNTRKVILESASLPTEAVSIAKAIDHNGSKVGYIQFNTFIPDAQDQWVTAINSLKNAGVTDLVVDMRYNGGGYISIAAQVGYMIAGANTNNKVFYQNVANSKMPKEDPWGFVDVGLYGLNKSLNLPTLNLQRVYVLATEGTCSASELVINSLRGIGVSVYLIGDTTCGKPYGFLPEPNCGTTYYTIQFKAVNAKGYGEYSDGFIPSTTDNGMDRVKGCSVADNLTYQLGDSNEPLLAAALQLRATGICPTASTRGQQKVSVDVEQGELMLPPTRRLMIQDR
ncbi:S41 family peptidase [Cellvibrio sp. pealriver]|uniref:S41 family peptidase n=1 Tax=Cellvibrio sp. pealriver TaxID=1622269 RepID=UPI0009E2EAEC|nr:S41 family peptidase [Cellvibrio sp. pealriver]